MHSPRIQYNIHFSIKFCCELFLFGKNIKKYVDFEIVISGNHRK